MQGLSRIGLVLGSGGVRGMAHFGVIRTLLKYGMKISCVAGSSSGSMIAAVRIIEIAFLILFLIRVSPL